MRAVDLIDVLAAHHRLEKIIVRTLITTIMLLLFTSQAQAVTNTYDFDGKLVSVSPLTLSDGMTYGVTIEYDIAIDGSSPGSGLTDELNDEAAVLIASGGDTPGLYFFELYFLSETQSGNTGGDAVIEAVVKGYAGGLTELFSDPIIGGYSIDRGLFPEDFLGTITFTKITAAVPEPLTATLIPLAVAPLLLRRRREA